MSSPVLELTHHELRVRGIGMHVVEAGSGPPLVLQHGYPQDWRSWSAVLPILAEHHRVICPDMRGFGRSDAPASGYHKEGLAQDLLAVTRALGVERFALAGHDWGGVVAFIAALRAPARVERLLLLNTSHLYWEGGPRFWWNMRGFWYMPLIACRGLGPVLLGSRWFPRLVLRWAHPGLEWDEATYEGYFAPLREQPARARVAAALRELPAHGAAAGAARAIPA